MQFLPVVEMVEGANRQKVSKRAAIVPPGTSGAQVAPWSITPKAFGRFMCDIFDEWVIRDVGERFVQLFAMSSGGLVFAAVLALLEGIIRGLI